MECQHPYCTAKAHSTVTNHNGLGAAVKVYSACKTHADRFLAGFGWNATVTKVTEHEVRTSCGLPLTVSV
jgi:hypothetical protein